jgi:hypothetical protein
VQCLTNTPTTLSSPSGHVALNVRVLCFPGRTLSKFASTVGGVLGGVGGAELPTVSRGIRWMARGALLDPVTGEPTVSPTSIVKRVLRSPEEKASAGIRTTIVSSNPIGPEMDPEEIAAPMNVRKTIVSKTPMGPMLPPAELGSPENPGFMAKLPSRMPKPAVTPLEPTPSIRGIARSAQPSEGRPATWTNEKVRELASWGDPDAMAQAEARGFGRIPLKYSEAELNPRSVTRFTSEGVPIQEGLPQGNPTPFGKSIRETGAPGLRPDVQGLVRSPAMEVPEWKAQEQSYELQKARDILRNLNATDEDKAVARARINESQ